MKEGVNKWKSFYQQDAFIHELLTSYITVFVFMVFHFLLIILYLMHLLYLLISVCSAHLLWDVC